MTSHDVVARARRIMGTRKVGHAGTLDPMATGVLVLGMERATKLLGHLARDRKTDLATLHLGRSTTTDDAEGEILQTGDPQTIAKITDDDLEAGIAKLTGDIQQVPSAVSAVKIDGKRAYARVRAGEDVVLPPRPVTVYRFDVLATRHEEDRIELDAVVECSSGTYVRALARDLGADLGIGGHLEALRRTTVGPFSIAKARTLDQLEEKPELSLAAERGLPSVLLTFDPHPSEVLPPGSHPAQLTTLRRKAELVESLGVDVFAVLPFTLELSRLPPEEFVHEVLVDRLHAAAVIVGDNFTFGAKAAGNVEMLRQLGKRFGFAAYGAELQGQALSEQEITFSSTYVRSCIDAGDVVAAAQALGRPHRLEGIVVRGVGRGHDLGYPTANLSTPRFAAVPADGVYTAWFARASDPDRRLRAAVSVGTNPTFSGRERTVE